MIEYIYGKLIDAKNDCIIIECGGIGYYVLISMCLYLKLPKQGQLLRVCTQLIQKDEQRSLYGFEDHLERECFRLLIGVSGVGPKLGMKILQVFKRENLVRSILNKDVQMLSTVKGLGKRIAERLILELSPIIQKQHANLISQTETSQSPANWLNDTNTITDALIQLGHHERNIYQALDVLSKQEELYTESIETIIKKALQWLLTHHN